MQKHITFLFISFFLNVQIIAQEVNLKGILLNKKDSLPIEYASIQIKNAQIGVLSNEVGKFILNFTDSSKLNKISFSCIGFKSAEIEISKLLTSNIKHEFVFFLEEENYELNEIHVKELKGGTNAFVAEALSRIKKNFISKNHLLNGFYRELRVKEGKFERMIEADVEIQDYGIITATSKSKIRVNELRKTDFESGRGFLEKTLKSIFGGKNTLVQTYRSPFLRRYATLSKNPEDITTRKFLDFFDFKYVSSTKLDGNDVYIIQYTPKGIKISSNTKQFDSYGFLYIKPSDFIILKQEEYFGNVAILEKLDFRELSFSTIIPDIFTKQLAIYDDKMGSQYPIFIENIKYVTKQEFEITLLMINNINTDKREFDRIRKKETLDIDDYLDEEEYEYRPDFWKNYNQLLLSPLDNPIKFDLERKRPLETQFLENGKISARKKWHFWDFKNFK